MQGLQVQSMVRELRSHIYCYSLAKSHLTLCNPMSCSMPGFLVLLCSPGFAQTHVLWVCDAIQPSHPLSLPSPTCCAAKKKERKKAKVVGLTVNLALQMPQWMPLTCLALDSKCCSLNHWHQCLWCACFGISPPSNSHFGQVVFDWFSLQYPVCHHLWRRLGMHMFIWGYRERASSSSVGSPKPERRRHPLYLHKETQNDAKMVTSEGRIRGGHNFLIWIFACHFEFWNIGIYYPVKNKKFGGGLPWWSSD